LIVDDAAGSAAEKLHLEAAAIATSANRNRDTDVGRLELLSLQTREATHKANNADGHEGVHTGARIRETQEMLDIAHTGNFNGEPNVENSDLAILAKDEATTTRKTKSPSFEASRSDHPQAKIVEP